MVPLPLLQWCRRTICGFCGGLLDDVTPFAVVQKQTFLDLPPGEGLLFSRRKWAAKVVARGAVGVYDEVHTTVQGTVI